MALWMPNCHVSCSNTELRTKVVIEQQMCGHDVHAKPRDFQVGELVYVKNYMDQDQCGYQRWWCKLMVQVSLVHSVS